MKNAGNCVANRMEHVPGVAQKACVAGLNGKAMGVTETWVFLQCTHVSAMKVIGH